MATKTERILQPTIERSESEADPTPSSEQPGFEHSFTTTLIPYLHYLRFLMVYISVIACPLSALARDWPHIAGAVLHGINFLVNAPIATVETMRRRHCSANQFGYFHHRPGSMVILQDVFFMLAFLAVFIVEVVYLCIRPAETLRAGLFALVFFKPWATVAPLAVR
jgi:hypothetical protein